MSNTAEQPTNSVSRIWIVGGLIVASVAIPTVAVMVSKPVPATAAIAGVIGLILLFAIALTRFELLTLMMIAGRTAIDITHSGDNDEGLRLSILVTGAYTLTAVVWLVARRIERPLRISWVAVAAVVVSLAAVLSGSLSTDREQALMGASRWVFLAVFLIALENLLVDQGKVRRLLAAVGVSTLVPLTLGTWQLVSSRGRITDGISRIEGSFAHPNTYGFYLAVIGLGLIAILGHIPRSYRIVGAALLAAILVNLLATYSRTSYVAFVVGFLVITLLGRRWMLLVVGVAAMAAVPLIPAVTERLAGIGSGSTIRGTPGDSLAWRIDYWQDVIEAGQGRRATGLGFGVVSDTTSQGREPHNDLVRAYVELGLTGLGAYLLFLLALGWQIRSALIRTHPAIGPPGLPRALAIGYAGIFSAYLVGSLTGNLMTQLILLWYVVALAVAAGQPARSHPKDVGRSLEPSRV